MSLTTHPARALRPLPLALLCALLHPAALAVDAADPPPAVEAAASAPPAEAPADTPAIEPDSGPATAAPVPAPAGPAAEVRQPRAFGHVLGDVLTQRVLLQHEGRPVRPAKLPAAQRLGVWLERRAGRIERDENGRDWLVVDYQLINAPQALALLKLPAWQVAGDGVALQVAEWPFSVAPLTPRRAFEPPGLDELRPDRAPPPVATAPLRTQFALWAGLSAASALAWLGWLGWRNRRAARSQPFARALRELRGLEGDAPAAWQALHRGFDRTAGRTVQIATLHRLFERAPQFEPLRADIERFYALSAELFFGSGRGDGAVSPPALARRLRAIEKRHER